MQHAVTRVNPHDVPLINATITVLRAVFRIVLRINAQLIFIQ